MKREPGFFKAVCALAIPVTLQSMLQSSFSIVDQIMIGQLGSVSVAGVGLAGKFASLFSVIVAAVGAVAGIMISQYLGQGNRAAVRRSLSVNLLLAAGIGGIFTVLCILLPKQIMGLYTRDADTLLAAAEYLAVMAGSFLPLAGATLLSTLLRCMEKPRLPLYASIVSALLNTGLNYVLIFGKLGLAPMGARGAAMATVIAQCANFLLMALLLPRQDALFAKVPGEKTATARLDWRQYLAMLLPILVCEGLWSLGENVYAAIYGHMGTASSAAMTLMNPVQGLVTGALCGLSQAAAILVGRRLGSGEFDGAYDVSKRLMGYTLAGAALLSAAVVLGRGAYVSIYQVEDGVKALTRQLMIAYALVAPCKVLNMVLGGGILRSGGRTKYVMLIDIIGTWGFGVPLGLLAAFRWQLTIPWVYFLLSLEEGVRLALSLALFRRRRWMRQLEAES